MAIKKSDLYSSLWASCDELRGDSADCVAFENTKLGASIIHNDGILMMSNNRSMIPRSVVGVGTIRMGSPSYNLSLW